MSELATIGQRSTEIDSPQVPDSGSVALMRLIEKATLSDTFDVAKLQQLLEVKERWEANEARKAFVVAKAAFKAEAPRIDKNKQVGFSSKRTGTDTSYRHATLDHVEAKLSPVLSNHGLSYSWETVQHDGGQIEVTCVLTHVLGHSERVSLRAGPDNSGNKNSIQAVGSTTTFLSRYTLLLVTGMATGDMDDDAGKGDHEPVTAEQKNQIIAKIRETGADTVGFCKYMAVSTVDDIPAKEFGRAMAALDAKAKQKEAK